MPDEGPAVTTAPPDDAGDEASAARSRLVAGSAFLTAVLALVLVTPAAPYAVESPGPTVDTLGDLEGEPLIVVDGAQTYPTDGSLLLTTVETRGGPRNPVGLARVVQGWLSSHEAVVPVEQVYPRELTSEELGDLLAQQMTFSQESATVAALTELGYEVPATLVVAGTEDGTGASGVLLTDDVVVGLGGQPVPTFQVLADILGSTPPGTALPVDLERGGERRRVAVVTSDDGSGGSRLGVFFASDFDLPIDVRIAIEDIGGPSAGLVFALGIVDRLTPGAMTGGESIAGTGTISADGAVGPISNVGLKVAAAARDGAAYFLAPAENCAEARAAVRDGPRIVEVATLAQARDAVTAIAEGRLDDLPTCSG